MNPQHVTFRTDASVQIGSGHVMRCLTLADALRAQGAVCQFICREHEGNLLEQIRQLGFPTYGLPINFKDVVPATQGAGDNSNSNRWLGADWATDAAQTKVGVGGTPVDWLIVDHYSLDARWEMALRPMCRRLMVIDDLADRVHDCDLLLDQNYYCHQNQRYQGLVSEQCLTLLGPNYVLLRPEFEAARQQLKVRDGNIKHILVFFGGSDPKNQTGTVLKALEQMNRPEISVDVVVGSTNPNRESIRAICDRLPFVTYHCNVSNMAELITNADLGIGAGGSAMWERCYLGLPTITVVFADNQVRTTEDVAALEAIEYIGWSDSLGIEGYSRAVSDAIANPQRIRRISDAALRIVNERTTIAVVDAMQKLLPPNSATLSTGVPITTSTA